MEPEKFTISQDNNRLITPCLTLILYASAHPREIKPGLQASFDAMLGWVGDGFKWYAMGNMKCQRAIEQDTLSQIQTRIKEHNFDKNPVLGIRMNSGNTREDNVSPAIDTESVAIKTVPPRNFIRLSFPVDRFIEGLQPFADICWQLAKLYPFSSGYAGYGLYWHVPDTVSFREVRSSYRSWLLNYPGFIHGDDFANAAIEGIADVNWLTFVGSAYLDKLGGISAIRDQLPKTVTPEEIPGKGIVLRAGETPRLGDLTQGESVHAYGVIGDLLAPYRSRMICWKIPGCSKDTSPALKRTYLSTGKEST